MRRVPHPPPGVSTRPIRLVALLLAVGLVAASCSDGSSDGAATPSDDSAPAGSDSGDPGDPGTLTLEVVSSPARYVTGSSAVLAVRGASPEAVVTVAGSDRPLDDLIVERDDRVALPSDLDGAQLFTVDGLEPGSVGIVVTSDGDEATIDLSVHSDRGPLFSGPRQEPYICTAADLGLDEPDEDCHSPSITGARYLDEAGTWVEIADDRELDGAPVSVGGSGEPVVVDTELGTINRAVYEIATPRGWNGSLVYTFGGGCGTGYNQGSFLGSRPADQTELLAAGYAVASSTLNTFQTACNDVLSAETLMMVKERFIEMMGPPRWTIGHGGSGGAIQQYLIAQNYPGLLDALSPLVSFPDAATIAGGVTDCGLLANFWAGPDGNTFTADQRLAVQGHGNEGFCSAWATSFLPAVDPSTDCAGVVPDELIYEPTERPDGARCTLQDSNVNLYGTGPDGFAHRALDNVGVEYGRQALAAGTISVEQFLDLNEAIGGYDIDGAFITERESAEPDVVETTYRTGRVLHGDSAVADVPVIDIDLYSDLSFDIHDRFRLFSIRDRMEGPQPDPSTRTRVIWTLPGGGIANLVDTPLPVVEIVGMLVDWLENTVDGTPVADARPDEVTDTCEVDGESMDGDDIYDGDNDCTEEYPIHGDPRTAAGAPRRNDIIKCTLKPADVEEYGVAFTDDQAARLDAVFPDGVCDWSVPGVGQVDLDGEWAEYGTDA